MKNVIKYKGYDIIRYVSVQTPSGDIIDECDTMTEAKKRYGRRSVVFKYAACEVINDRGDCNPSVYGSTLKEATDKLKKLLS